MSVSRLPFRLSVALFRDGRRAGGADDDVDDDDGLSSHVWSDAHGLSLFFVCPRSGAPMHVERRCKQGWQPVQQASWRL